MVHALILFGLFSATHLHCMYQSLPDIGASDIAVSALKSLGVLRPSKIQVYIASRLFSRSALITSLVAAAEVKAVAAVAVL